MKRFAKIFLIILLLIIMLFSLTACGEEENSTTTESNSQSNSNSKGENVMTEAEKFKNELKNLSVEEVKQNGAAQFAEPEEGDTIAILHIEGYGDVKIKFFENIAPKACENFITHAKEGYYNGLTFHRVIEEFMIQGGDPLGNGTGGESIWGEDFGEELSPTVLPYKGALCMASRGTGTKSIGSQFFIVQANYNEEMEQYLSYYGYSNLLESYKQYSGDLFDLAISYQYTTFGQVIEGLDVVDKIAATETDTNDKPVSDVKISSIEITTYSK